MFTQGRLKWVSAITRLTAHLHCGLISAYVISKQRKQAWSYMTLNAPTGTRCHHFIPQIHPTLLSPCRKLARSRVS